MANFEQLNSDINNVLISLIDNQNLCKLLKYTSNNPFKEIDIEDTTELLTEHICPLPRIPSVQSEQSSLLLVLFDSFRQGDNKGTKEWKLKFEIIVHNKLWLLTGTGKIRPVCIMHEIDEMFNNQRIVGIKKVQQDQCQLRYYNENYSGYILSYSAVSAN